MHHRRLQRSLGSALTLICAWAPGPLNAQVPVGVDAMTQFGRIAELRPGFRAGQNSSHDLSGGNSDHDRWLNVETSGEKVMLDLAGAGCVYRIWFTAQNYDVSGRIRIYFDGATSPTVDMVMQDFFSGTQAPFLYPLVGNYSVSSGGFYCYVPMPFRTGCRITTTNAASLNYFNVTYHQFADATGVTTFTPAQDVSAAQALWNAAGADPKVPGQTAITGVANIAAGATFPLVTVASPGMIQSIELNWPGLGALQVKYLQDSGREMNGQSQFTVAIEPGNDGVKLVRRLQWQGSPGQKGDVYIDNVYAGTWSSPDGHAGLWRDAGFWIPSALTAGKSSIQVRVQYVSPATRFNEFYYWIYSLSGAQSTLTDHFDVGNTADESAHQYTATLDGSAAPLLSISSRYQNPQTPERYADDGRSFLAGGRSEFTVRVESANNGVVLSRRYDTATSNQRATVYVDDGLGNWQSAGLWTSPNDNPGRFKEASFTIPASLTAGKSQLHLRVQSAGGDPVWFEHYYWIYSVVGSSSVLTDEIDVGKSDGEAFHAYSIASGSFNGVSDLVPITLPFNAAQFAMQALRLQATWDEQVQPAVDAPINSFFGSGLGPAPVKALPLGIDGDRLYCYFPMPFGLSGAVSLHNTGATAINGIGYTIRYATLAQAPSGVGYFHAAYHSDPTTTAGVDYPILETTGSGHFVGVVQTSKALRDTRVYLEGDERIYVDGRLTPALYGTGTEDFYNSGWYFKEGIFSRPVHGEALYTALPYNADTCYRFLLSDLIPFTNSIKVGIEHGANNDESVNMQSVAFYYHRDNPLSVLSDQIDVGDTASELAHQYIATNSTAASLTSAYEGDDSTQLSDTGRQLAASVGSSQFNVALTTSNNAGVVLRRRLDYRQPRQAASVLIDNVPAGTWYDAGQNTFLSWRDSEFVVPASLTQGKSSVVVRVQVLDHPWTEFHYWAHTLVPLSSLVPLGTLDYDSDGVLDNLDNCPLTFNISQSDADGDHVGDACDVCPNTLPGLSVDAQGCSPFVPGDFDRDGDVDQSDFGHFQFCLSGTNVAQTDPNCTNANLDADAAADVDLQDYAIFQKCLTGSDIPASPTCAQ